MLDTITISQWELLGQRSRTVSAVSGDDSNHKGKGYLPTKVSEAFRATKTHDNNLEQLSRRSILHNIRANNSY